MRDEQALSVGQARETLESVLHNFVSEPADRLVLIAPFIKRAVMRRLLDHATAATTVDCYTRWEAAEVATGVSDPSIIDLAGADSRLRIHLVDRVHTKLYANQTDCLIGSANLTGAALGVTPRPNLEVLIRIPRSHQGVEKAISDVITASRPATQEDADNVRRLAALLERAGIGIHTASADEQQLWYPKSLNPRNVFLLYNGAEVGMSVQAKRAALEDIAGLGLPLGLDESQFQSYVAAILYDLPVLSGLKAMGSLNQLDLEGKLQMAGVEAPGDAAGSIARWILYADIDCRSEAESFRLVLRRARQN